MIDHVSFAVQDYATSQEFYDNTLKTLGYARLMTFEVPGNKVAGYGRDGKPSFWIGSGGNPEEAVGAARGLHIAFSADSVEAVHAWYEAALAAGGQDNGAPGPRPQYHPGYYGAFIVDPNGWRIEAAFQQYQG